MCMNTVVPLDKRVSAPHVVAPSRFGIALALLVGLSVVASMVAVAADGSAAAINARGSLSVPAQSRPAEPEHVRTLHDIHEYRLANGLQLLLIPDASRPVVTVQLTVRAGAAEDPAGASGAMHLLEHLMYRSRPGHGAARAEIAERGIRANAMTSHDRTTFLASFAADEAVQRWYLQWLSGAFADGDITSAQVESELGAIRNEMQAAQGSALGVTLDAAMWTLYAGQGYGKPQIGRLAEIESVHLPALSALRAEWYRPDNATLIVAGAFDTEDTLRMVAQGFGRVPPPGPKQRSQPDMASARDSATAGSIVLSRPGMGPIIVAAATGPAARDVDAPAARLLAYALTREPSGILNQRLVETGIAARVLGQARAQASGGMLLFAAQPAAGKEPAAVAEALRAALSDADELTPEQLEQARHGWMAEWRRRFNDPERLADDLSEAAGRGDWRLHLADYAGIRALGLDDLRRVANQWLKAPLLAIMLPEDAASTSALRTAREVVLPDRTAAATAAAYRVRARQAQRDASARTRADTMTLADGRLSMSVARHPQRGGAVLARLAIPVLDASSSQEQTRAAGLTAAMLNAFRNVPDGPGSFQYELDRIETTLSVGFFRQELLIDVRTSADQFDAAMARVGMLLQGSRFEEEALEAEKRKWRGRLDSASKDPVVRLEELLSRHGNPYGQSDVRYAPTIEEESASLQRVGLADIEQTHAALMPLRGARMAVVGGIDPAVVTAAMKRHLVPLLIENGPPAPMLVDDMRQAPPPGTLVWRSVGTDNVDLTWAAFLPLRRGERDALALALGNRMFGQQGSGRLWRRLREREGLSYGAWSEFDWNAIVPSSWWRMSASFSVADADRVQRALVEEMERVQQDGFGTEELALAKVGYLQEHRRLRVQPQTSLGRQLELLRAGTATVMDEGSIERQIAGLSLDDVNAAWRRHILIEGLVRAAAGALPEDPSVSTDRTD